MVVDNRGGAQGSIGTALGAKAAPDGYTILLAHSGALVINPHMYDNPGYDTLKNFAPVTRGTEMPYILVLHPSVPAKSMRELAQLAKQHPGKLRALAVSGAKRDESLPEIPTMTEAGFKDFGNYIPTQYVLWGKLVEATGARAN